MVVGYHHFRKHPNPFWFAVFLSLPLAHFSVIFSNRIWSWWHGDTHEHIFKGQVSDLQRGRSKKPHGRLRNRDDWAWKVARNMKLLRCMGCAKASLHSMSPKKPWHLVFVFQTEVESISLNLWYLANLNFLKSDDKICCICSTTILKQCYQCSCCTPEV